MKVKLLITGIFLVLLLAGCHKDNTDIVVQQGFEYFPLIEGQWIEYQVDSVKYFGEQTDTTHWFVKEIIGTTISSNRIAVYRYFRKNELQSWTESPLVWTASLSQSEAQKIENNVCFLKLVFPLKEGKKWDGNLYNNLESQEYTMTDLDKSLEINGNVFSTTLKVIQADITTLISQDYSEEVFAKNIGMISSHKVHIENLQSLQHKTGYTTDYTIINWGKP